MTKIVLLLVIDFHGTVSTRKMPFSSNEALDRSGYIVVFRRISFPDNDLSPPVLLVIHSHC